MRYKTANGNSVLYMFDYGKVTRNEYLLFDNEIDLVNIIQDFKNSRMNDKSVILKQQFLEILLQLKQRYPNAYFASIPSSKANNYNRTIDRIADEINNKDSRVFVRKYDIEPAHLSGHTDEHYQEFEDSLRINHIDNIEIIIIDDICTSGRTIDICKEMLEISGKIVVDIVVVGKTIGYTNLDVGNYTLDIVDIVTDNDHSISIKFSNGGYFRVKDSNGFKYAFQHETRFIDFPYPNPENVPSLPINTTVFIKVFIPNPSKDFKAIRVVFKRTNIQVKPENLYPEFIGVKLRTFEVYKFFRKNETHPDIVTYNKLNNSIYLYGENDLKSGDIVTAEFRGRNYYSVLEVV